MSDNAPAAAAPAAAPASGPKGTDAAAKVPNTLIPGQNPTSGGVQDVQTVEDTKSAAPKEEVYEVVVNGKTVKLTKEQLILRAQKAEAASEQFRESAKVKKELAEQNRLIETLLKDLIEDPDKVYSALGQDPDKIRNDWLAKKAKMEAMDPAERQRKSMEAELNSTKTQLEQAKAERQAEIQKTMDDRQATIIEQSLVSAAQKHGLPKTPKTLELMVNVAMEALDYGVEMTGDQVAAEVKFQQAQELEGQKSRIDTLSGDELLNFLGKENVSKLLKATKARIPVPGAQKPVAPTNTHTVKPPDAGYTSPKDFEKKMEEMIYGLGKK